MNLHVEVSGQGEPLVLLHGWGMHGGVWSGVLDRLAQNFTVHVVDLPGHGYSKEMREAGASFTLDNVVDELRTGFVGRVNVLGWSLGGIVAQAWAARETEQVSGMVLVASTPCFANRADWESGMPQEMLAQFAQELERDFTGTLRRFIALQLRGSEKERELLAMMRERLFNRGEPDMAALRGGLNILREADLRAKLHCIKQPVLVIAGDRDRLTPLDASRYMAQAMPHAQLCAISGSAHAPFLSHREEFLQAVEGFLIK